MKIALLAVLGLWIQTAFAAPVAEVQPRRGLPNVAAKLRAGEAVRVAYLGGSITEANGWRPLTTAWLQQQFPAAKISEISAGVPGTGSDFGVARLQRDVLSQNPDLLFVEFAVNDQGRDPAQIERTTEGIVRQTWRAHPTTDICLVYTVAQGQLAALQNGELSVPAQAMERVAAHYGIPSIALGVEVARALGAGKMIFTGAADSAPPAFSGDGTHPNATGHRMYRDAIARSFPVLQTAGEIGPHELGAPLRADNWEAMRAFPLSQITRTANWEKLEGAANPLAPAYAKRLPELWRASAPGAAITFRFNGQGFGFGGVKGPDSGTFSVTVDDQAPIVTTFFDSFSREGRFRLKPWFYPNYLAPGEHQVRIELLKQAPPKAEILAKAGVAMTDPAQFAGNTLTIGEVYVVGVLLAE